MRRYLLIAVVTTTMALAIEESQTKKIPSWMKNYQPQVVRWGSSSSQAKPSTAETTVDQQQPNTPTTKLINAEDPVQSEGSRVSSLLPEKCGVDAITNPRVIGGRNTHIKQHPWLAQIEYHDKKLSTSTRDCGGFLISHRYVLSAGHCFRIRPSLEPINVILGEYDQTHEGQDCIDNLEGDRECTDGAIAVPIDEITIHPLHRSSLNENHNDIALVRMKRTVENTKFIRPICLPTSDITESPPADLHFIVAGWGRTESGDYSSVKRQVNLPYVNTKECRGQFDFLTGGHMCAGGEAGKDACYGDSGSPLMHYRDEVYTAVGIVSSGNGCAKEGYKGIYTKVFKYMSWISDNIKP